jgi:xylulokinase
VSDLILAVDLGAGSLRAAAVTPRGRVIAAAARPLAPTETQPGWSEIDPELWWRALATTVGKVLDKLPRSTRVAGICLAALTRSQVLLDGDARALRPAMLFRDRRASAEANEVACCFAAENPAAITAFHPLARIAWLARHEPALFDRLAAVAEPKDFLNARLTGRLAGDSVTYSRFDALTATRALPAALRRCIDLLAVERVAPWAVLGPVICREKPFDRLAGVPVFAGSMDAWASAIGAGAAQPGQAYDVAGTSEVVGLITRERQTVPGLVSLLWGEDVHQIGGPTQAGADCARWCHEIFRLRGGLAAAIERAGRQAPAADLPLFLPYLAGERAPLWRDDLRAAFHRVSRTHGPDEFLWAVLEGVAHAVRDIVAMASGDGAAPRELIVCGGGARSDAWCQLKADVAALPVARAASRETGPVGCAIAAAFGLGRYPSLAAASEAMSPVERIFTPQPAIAAFYLARAESYRRARACALEMVA